MTPRYQRLDGFVTTADDPTRSVWYSAVCTFWTDEWDRFLTTSSGIPVCPYCKRPGYITTAQGFDVSQVYEDKHPGYTAALAELKNTRCQSRVMWMERFK